MQTMLVSFRRPGAALVAGADTCAAHDFALSCSASSPSRAAPSRGTRSSGASSSPGRRRPCTAVGIKRPREAYPAQKGDRLPHGIFVHIIGYWRSSRDYLRPAPA